MKCYRCYFLVLLLAVVIDQGFSNEAATEPHNREKRQGQYRGQRGPPHRPGEGPHRHPDEHRGPDQGHHDDRYAQPLSGGRDDNDSPRVENRFAQAPSTNLLGISLNLGGLSPQNPMGGMGNLPAMLGQNMGFTNAPNTGGLLGLGGSNGLLGLGGQPNAGTDYRPNNRPQGPEHNNPQGNQGGRPSQPHQGEGHPPNQGRPGGNQQGNQGHNRPGQQPGRPGQQPGRPGQGGGRPNGEGSFVNERPSYNDYSEPSGNQGQGGSNERPNQGSGQGGGGGGGGGGNKKCRGNQFTCNNRVCVPRNARCNGVTECLDGSDELNCNTSDNGNSGGGGTPTDRYTTAAPLSGVTTASPGGGCSLPEKPTGGIYELGSCEQPCNLGPGSKVPIGSYLTYRCETGYTLKGNNVTFCHGGTWYQPPTCAKTCPPLKSTSVDIVCKLNGDTVLCESAIAPGTKATMACKRSYKIPLTDDPGYRELTCLDEGIWDRTLLRCIPECGTAVSHGNTLIVNGFTAKLGVFPWHVGIYQRNSAGKYDQICAGNLIGPDLVVSAAHCFYDDTVNAVQDPSQYAVGAGKHYRLFSMPEKYAQTSQVKKIDVADRYYGASGNFAEDIALVRLETPFTLNTLVRPICMDWDNTHEREQLQSGQSGKAVGWGKTAEGVPSTELQEINLPFIPYQECVSAVPEEFRAYVTADKFCAGYLNGSSLCEGDSGGGLCFQLDGYWYLRGIVSVSPVSEGTCDNNYYTAFTNVGRFREWIRAAYVNMV